MSFPSTKTLTPFHIVGTKSPENLRRGWLPCSLMPGKVSVGPLEDIVTLPDWLLRTNLCSIKCTEGFPSEKFMG